MRTDVELWQAAASLVLIAIVIAISLWRRLGLERSIIWATIRATVQLLAVGVLFAVIFESRFAQLWAWCWVAVMLAVSAFVVMRRTSVGLDFLPIALGALGLTVAVVLAVVFGLGVLDFDSVSVVVIAGITLGNTMPTVVQSVDRTRSQFAESAGQVEAMLALGFDARGATQEIVRQVTKLALVPQIERTKVVGLIALPGAMTGLLLADVDPLDAVLIQIVVMFLVLGSVAVSVVVVTSAMARRALTPDLRLQDWVRASRPS